MPSKAHPTYYTDTKDFLSRMMDRSKRAKITARDGIAAAIALSYLTGERPIPGVTNHISVTVTLPDLIKQAASARRDRAAHPVA